MSDPHRKSFSIEHTINPVTKQPFGPKYAGTFSIRRASIFDSTLISAKKAAERNLYGRVDADQIPPGLALAADIYHHVSHVALAALPEWFDRSLMFSEEDQHAMSQVWLEVQTFEDSFWPSSGNRDSGSNGDVGTVPVPAALQSSPEGPQIP